MQHPPRSLLCHSIGTGTIVAFVCSLIENHSLLWAIVHAVYSWFYVAYLGLTKLGLIFPVQESPVLLGMGLALAVGVAAIAITRLTFRSRP